MTTHRESIDYTLVHLFNDILRIEEDTLRLSGVDKGLSMREIHVLQAIGEAGERNTMSEVASLLHVAAGSLTVAVNTLCRKGYVTRVRSEEDKRRIHLHLTQAAEEVQRIHRAFHTELTEALMGAVPPEQLDALCAALERVTRYFYEKEKENQQ